MVLKWICSSQCHVTVFAGFVPICLHLLEGSTQSHMGRSVFLTTAWSSSECLKRWPSFNGVCFCFFLQTSACRLDAWLSARVESLHQAGYSQYAHDLFVLVDIWNRRIPGWCDKWGWAGSSVHSIPTLHCSLYGNFFSFFLSRFWRDYYIHPFIFYCFHETVKLITLITPLITF